MKKMIKRHRGRVSLKERMLKNSRVWRRLTRKESGAGLRRAESPRRRTGVEGTESLGLTKRRRNSLDVEEGHRGGRLRSSRECDAEEHFSRDRIRQTVRSKNG